MRRDRICRWYCHWSMVSLLAVTLLYSMLTNVWLLHPACPAPPPPPPAAPAPAPCDPCRAPLAPERDPVARLDVRLGRWDANRTYRLFDAAAVGGAYSDTSLENKVCLATQTSIDRLPELLKIADHWSGPISVGVFVAGEELQLLRGFVIWLSACRPETYARLALHVAMPRARPGVHGPPPDWAQNCDKPPLQKSALLAELSKWRTWHPYPQNHMRNIARKNCQTPFVFLVDIDIVPSRGMAESLNTFLEQARCERCAYVVPTYEVHEKVPRFPDNKAELIHLARTNLAVPFHKRVFIYNQHASNFSRWEESGGNETQATHVSHNVTNFELLYEPFYVARDDTPPHDERFVGYGFTRNSQVYELFMMGFEFRVLSPIFTIHWGLQARHTRPLWRERQNEQNRKVFLTFKRELFARYRKDPLHLLKKPPAHKKT